MIGPCLTQGIRSHQTHGRVGNEAGTMGLKGYRAAIQGIGKLGEGGLVDEPDEPALVLLQVVSSPEDTVSTPVS